MRLERYLLSGFLGLGSLALVAANQRAAEPPPLDQPPNVIIVFADDLGYGDLGVYGHPTLRTPRLDRMAEEGQRWTSFYAAASICTPSRAALLTGRLPVRSGMAGRRGVLYPDSAGGLPQSELTIAAALQAKGYATAAMGKWHLGHLPEYLPTSHGFDSYFGIPYSNDMDRVPELEGFQPMSDVFWDPKVEDFDVPLMRDEEVIERPADQRTITKRYTEESLRFIREHKERPFFLYLAHSLPHVPLFASEGFLGKSPRGLYGDVVEEIDWSVGQILDTLQAEGLAERTLVVFTSDNGPWLAYREHGGSAGLLRDGKGTTFEGGMREPALFWWPGRIQPGVVRGIGSTLDLLPTLCALAEVPIPDDRVIDGVDLGPTLFEGQPSPRDTMLFYRGRELFAVRKGPYKAHFATQPAFEEENPVTRHDPPLLYHLGHDPSEHRNIAAQHPEIIEQLRQLATEHRKQVVPGEDQTVARIDP